MDFITLASSVAPRLLEATLSTDGQNNSLNDAESSGMEASSESTLNPDISNAPALFSPSAEAELLLLATNFLLYVAMVIITTLVCKIYFPESLEAERTPPLAKSYSFRIREDDESSNSAYYSSDSEEGLDDKSDNGLEMEETKGLTDNIDGAKTKKKAQRKEPKSSTLQKFLEFDPVNYSRTSVIKRLMFCSLMLNLTFVTWGLLQERMLTRRYPRFTGEYFTYSYALVFSNRLWTLIMSGLLLLYLKPRRSRSTVIYEYSFSAISNMLSSWCQYEALRYVSFPATTLFKCFKLVPVMFMGKILGNKEYPQYDYLVALVMGVGISIFMSSTDDLQFGYDIHGVKAAGTWTGIMLLGWFLFFDSFTGQWQSRMFQQHSDLSIIELLFATSAFSTVLSFITLVHTGELWPAIDFVLRHSEIHIHFFLFSLCSTIGQLFIFYTIKNFGAVVFTIIMTTRLLISIALSCFLYGHSINAAGFFGLVLVCVGVLYRIKRKSEGTQFIKWQGMGDEKAIELVQEWHEHLDM